MDLETRETSSYLKKTANTSKNEQFHSIAQRLRWTRVDFF